jgi:hypothetical protein
METAGNKKNPSAWRLFEGFARDGSLPGAKVPRAG